MSGRSRVLENLVMQTVQECILDGGYLERHFERLQQQMERDRDNDKVERLSQQQVELEGRIDTALEMLMDRRIPQQERIISKLQQDEQRLEQVSNELKVLQDTTVPTQKQIGDFRDQIRAELKTGERKNKNRLSSDLALFPLSSILPRFVSSYNPGTYSSFSASSSPTASTFGQVLPSSLPFHFEPHFCSPFPPQIRRGS